MARQRTVDSPGVYTGAWRAASTYSDRALPPGPGVDPSHMRPDMPDPGTVVAGYPRVDHAPLYLTQETDDSFAFALDTPGFVYDSEPITHDADDPQIFHSDPGYGGQAVAPQARAHMVDRGAQLRTAYEEPQMRAEDEEPRTERWEQAPIETPSLVAIQRGTNSLDVNNPDGYRIGWSVKRYYHRRMLHEQFKHTERALHPAGAASAVVSPAMSAENSNRYTSPFAWRSFYGTRNWQLPLMRRQPPESWDADSDNDGSQQISDVPADWVVG
jgi:hypothetical protein